MPQVQNLLLAIGSNVYFERDDQSPQDSLDPFPFTLEPLSKSALGKYAWNNLLLGKQPTR